MKGCWAILAGCVFFLMVCGLALKPTWLANVKDWFQFAATPPRMESSPGENLRLRPLVFDPPGDLANTVSDKELEHILELLEPYWEYWRASDLLHALRLWGPDAVFPPRAVFKLPDNVGSIASAEMLGFFLDERQYRRRYPGAKTYFFPRSGGLGVREGTQPSVTAHRDDFLALAAELGLPTDTLLRWGNEPSHLRSVFAYSFKWFHPHQELEFTSVAYAYYLQAGANWTDRFGMRHDLNEVVEQLLAKDLTRCACYGTHVPYALAILLSRHSKEPCLSQETYNKAETALKYYSRDLVDSQSGAGYWSRRWCRKMQTAKAVEGEDVEWIRCTGHHLEWIALVRPELRPPQENIRRAIRYLMKALGQRSTSNLSRGNSFNESSHAARALVLLKGKRFASELMTDNWKRRGRRQ